MGTMRKYLEFQYEEIELLSAKKNIYLVKDRISSQIFVKRELPLSMVEIYGKLKRVCHQNLVRIVEVYTLLDACIVIEEYINGMSLEQLFNMKGVFPEDVSVLYFRALLEALKALHDVELVHRDVNMSNIRITTDGVLKLMGFAAVRKVRGDGNVDTVLMGTDGTAAPEQFGFSESDARADVYAAGVLLNQMLTGSFPVLRRYIGTKKIEEIIDKCIQIDKHKRYDRVEQIIQTLDQISGPNVQKLYSMLPGLRVKKWYGRLAVCCGYEFFCTISLASWNMLYIIYMNGENESCLLWLLLYCFAFQLH